MKGEGGSRVWRASDSLMKNWKFANVCSASVMVETSEKSTLNNPATKSAELVIEVKIPFGHTRNQK